MTKMQNAPLSHQPSIPGAWKRALELLRAIEAAPPEGGVRDRAIRVARAHFETSGDARLASLAHLLVEGMSPSALLTVLVPVERVAVRARITDADCGITTQDRQRRETFPLTVVADNLRSAFNLGGLFRTADTVGAARVFLCGYTAGPDSPQVARSALGAERAVPCETFANVRDAISRLRGEGARVYALETARDAVPVEAFAFQFPCALVLGSERFGLDGDVVASADAVLRLRTYGMKNSLNVVSAFAVAAYAARVAFNGSGG